MIHKTDWIQLLVFADIYEFKTKLLQHTMGTHHSRRLFSQLPRSKQHEKFGQTLILRRVTVDAERTLHLLAQPELKTV